MNIEQLLNKNSSTKEIIDIIAHVLRKDKTWILIHPDHSLTASQTKKIQSLINRYKSGEPLAYILGYKYFYGLKLKVTKHTLIPRPETELLVDQALEIIKDQKSKIKNIIDIGTGSGCIAISLAKSLPKNKYKIYGSDISEKALTVAKMNANLNGTRVQFTKNDLMKDIDQNFDLIIANLPYLDKSWITDSIKFEPRTALFTSKKGLALIEKLLTQVCRLKTKPKFLLLEFDPRQKRGLAKLIKSILPAAHTKFYRDYAGRWRIAAIKLLEQK